MFVDWVRLKPGDKSVQLATSHVCEVHGIYKIGPMVTITFIDPKGRKFESSDPRAFTLHSKFVPSYKS